VGGEAPAAAGRVGRLSVAETALVTGGGGFLGRAIVDQLLARGDAVRVLGRRDYPDLAARGVECAQGDLADADAVRGACQGVDVVFHTAALPGMWGSRAAFERTNVEGTRNVLEACRAQGVGRLVHTSTPSVVSGAGLQDHAGVDESEPYPERFLAHYPRTKAQAEREVLAADGEALRTTALRPHLIFGPGDPHLVPRVIARARAGRLRIVGPGDNLVDMTYVDNAARAHLQAAAALSETGAPGGKAYFLSNGEPVQLWPWINALLERLGVPPIRKRISLRAAYRVGQVMEVLWRLLPGEPPMTRFVAGQLATSHWFDISAARRDFGYDPEQIPMAEAEARLHAYYEQGEGRSQLA
jgi:2-alkyl-3-oxoalkanoate reductase